MKKTQYIKYNDNCDDSFVTALRLLYPFKKEIKEIELIPQENGYDMIEFYLSGVKTRIYINRCLEDYEFELLQGLESEE